MDLDTEWQGFAKGLFGQGLLMLKTSGRGDLFINTFGAIDKHDLEPGEELIVDNFHLVAFSDTCDYKVTKFGGLKGTILGGEGLVTRIRGPGEVLIQTKKLREFVEWLWSLIEPRVRGRARYGLPDADTVREPAGPKTASRPRSTGPYRHRTLPS